MAGLYKWDPDLIGLNIKEMDDEHKILINKMNALHQAKMEGKLNPILKELLGELIAYTIKHFSDEEAYMAKIRYDGIETHKLNHKKLLDSVNNFAKDFEKSGVLADELFIFLGVWLTSHIRGVDMKYSKKSS